MADFGEMSRNSAVDVRLLEASVGMAGFEPAFSCAQGRRIARLSYIPWRFSSSP